jgi:RNA polymerase sigma-70 factor (ECF subfamily)
MALTDPRQTPDVELSGHVPDPHEPPARARLDVSSSAASAAGGGVESAARPLDFRTLFELEVGYVMRTLRRLSVAPADLEDLAHDVFLAVHQQLHRYDPARPLRPWLFGFALRVASHYRRKSGREAALAADDDLADAAEAPDALLEKERRRRLVLAALDEIELSRRAVFVLHELDGFTCEEIARTLEIPIGTTYSRLRLARQDFTSAMTRLNARRAIG